MAQIFPLPEGLFTVGHDKRLIPFREGIDILNERAVGSLLVEIQPFLVVTGNEVIIFDTGLGLFDDDGELQIHNNIRKHGYTPEQVTKVFLSHLHKDHSGCMTYTSNGMLKTTFPNATYYIYRPEAEYALKTGLPSYDPATIEPIFSSTQVHWLDGETGTVDGIITFTHSGGHCPQHIVFLVDDEEDKIFYGGDEVPQLKQLKIKYIAKYDFDGKKAQQLREVYAAEGIKDNWKFLFYHDAKNPIASLK